MTENKMTNEIANDIWSQNIEQLIACDRFEDAFNVYHTAVECGCFGDALFGSGVVEIKVDNKIKSEINRLFPELNGYEK